VSRNSEESDSEYVATPKSRQATGRHNHGSEEVRRQRTSRATQGEDRLGPCDVAYVVSRADLATAGRQNRNEDNTEGTSTAFRHDSREARERPKAHRHKGGDAREV